MQPCTVITLVSMLLSILAGSHAQLTFSNPILDRNSADPCILRVGNFYYLTLSENTETELTIFKSPILTNFRNAESSIAYRTPPGYSDLWASEMHEVDGELYIYFTMRTAEKDHRMYVIKADNPADPMGNWSEAIRLLPDWDFGSIDGTVMKHGGQNYFVWASTRVQFLSIYIAPLINPTLVGRPTVLLRQPKEDWECQGGCTNEGPFFIYNRNVSYMIFSASSTWDPGYCLTQMSLESTQDPMDPINWVSAPGPVFSRNDEEDVYTTGHAAFTVSPDLTETWMVYHGTVNTTHINGFRTARIEKIEWNDDGSPRFPEAHGYNNAQPVPSGQTEKVALLQSQVVFLPSSKKTIMYRSVLMILVGTLAFASSQSNLTFRNPIFDRNSADPCAYRLGDYYYLSLSENRETELTIFKSPILTSFRDAETKIAYTTPTGYSDLWASEMHEVDGELYLYFTMGSVNFDLHRMFVIKADNASDPMGNWSDAIRLLPDWDYDAIDGTVMKHDGKNYFVWASGRTGHLSIYIAPFVNATLVGRPIVLLREPKEDWECEGGCTNEGPYFIYNKNVSYMIISASSTWTPGYCLTLSSIEFGKDPMDPSNWVAAPGPLFIRNDEEDVYTTGHAAFTVSPDLTETWMVYHGTVNTTHINGFRTARIEKIDWNEDGSPLFPKAHGYNHSQPVPSGQTSV
ncbi:unnamed protein product [Orchesella dallaii]|uniref:Extracellular exo-alpha-(1->5)-L-arabinofuranosidase n=1 Tax=Orchesella dallaii TaxID=48710 RepID=A0ABP1PUF2_9HEXA